MTAWDPRRIMRAYWPDALLFLGCFAGSALWLIWSHVTNTAPPIALSIGVAAAGLILGGVRRWPAVALAVLLAFFLVEPSRPVISQLAAVAGLTGGAVTTAALIRRRGICPTEILDPRSLVWVLIATVAGALFTTLVGLVGAWAAGQVATPLYEFVHRATRLGLGLELAAPLVLVWATPPHDRWRPAQWLGFAAVLLLCAATAAFTFLSAGTGPIAWLVYPPLILAALLFHLRGAASATAIAALIILWGTGMGTGPFALASPAVRMLLAQGFVAISCATMLLLASFADKRREEEKARQAQQRYRAVFEQTGVGVAILSLDGRYLDVNDRACAITGYARDELIGHDFTMLVVPDEIGTVSATIAALANGEIPVLLQDRTIRTRQGEERSVHVTSNLVRRADGTPDHLISVVQDISERVKAEAALSESEKRLRLAQEAAGVGVWEIDLVRGGSHHSPESARMFGLPWRKGEYRMADFIERVGEEQVGALRAAIAEAGRTRGPLDLTLSLTLPGGATRWVNLHGSYDHHDGHPRLLGLAIDITHDVEAQGQLREAHDKLLRVARLSAMGAMASTLAHELNQPLSAISNYVETCRYLLRAGATPDAAMLDALDLARDQTMRAGNIIRRIRSFTVSGEISRQPVDLEAVVRSACHSVQKLRLATGVLIECRFDMRSAPLLGDALQLEQVVANLARNAVEATEGCARREVAISTTVREREVLVQVTDSGEGVGADMIENLFEPFRTTKAGGTGLGLPICRTIVEAHGGRLWAENAPQGGATFSFTLPIATEDEMLTA